MSSTGHLSELDLLRSQVADLSRELAEQDRSGQDLREQSDLLRAIVAGTAAETGEEFFVSLVTHLTSVLHVQYAIIGEVQGDRIKKIRTLAVSAGGALVENFEYELAHTPCATALTETFACFDRDAQVTFPQFQRLADLGAESYCAVPLRTKGGAVIGLLVVMDTKPLEHSDSLQSLLGVFAPRVTAEFERRRAEQERAQAQAQAQADLHNVIEAIPDIVFALNRQGNLVKWNQRVEEVTGYSSAELVGMPALAFVPPEEQLSTIAAIQRAFTEGYAALDSHLLTKDQRLIPYHCTGALLKNSHGEPIGIIGIGRDVSEKKRAEEALRESEAFNLSVLNSLSSQIVVLNSQGVIMAVNKPWLRFAEENEAFHLVESFVGMNYLNVCAQAPLFANGEEAASAQAGILAVLAGTHNEFSLEYPCHSPDRQRWFRMRVTPLLGSQVGVVVAHENITERKQAEEAMHVSEERLTLAARGSNTGIWDWDLRTNEVYFSPIWKGMLGYEVHELRGEFSEWEARLHPDDRPRALATVRAYLDRATPQYELEHRLRHKDGSYRWVLAHGITLSDAAGIPYRMAGSHIDITERKQAEEALRLAKFSMDQASDAIYWIDPQAKILDVNDAASLMLGYSKDELCALTVHDLNPDFPASLWPGFWAETERRGTMVLETAHRAKDGRLIPIEVSINYLAYEGKEYHCAFVRNITERKRAEHESQERAVEALSLQRALLELAHLDDTKLTFSEVVPRVTKLVADTLAVERVSLWLLSEDRTELVCQDLYECLHAVHSTGSRLSASNYPRYFSAIENSLVVAASDALVDPRTSEFADDYFPSLGITSVLDVPIFRQGALIGVLWCEHVGEPRKWAHEAQDFAVSVGQTIIRMMETAERKQVEEALRLTKFAVDRGADMAFWIDRDARISYVNDAACERLGYTREELLAMTVLDFDSECPVSVWAQHWDELKAQKRLRFERTHRTKAGDSYPVEIVANYVMFEGQEYNFAFCRDITDRKRAEEELRKSHSFLRQVIDINPNFIFAKDRDGRFTLANKAVADVYGTMVEDLIGKTDADFNPNQEEVAFFRQKDLAVMDTLQELFFSEEVITDSGGRTRWLQTVKKPILDDEGRAMMVLGSSTDITERKQMEETLRQRERALRAAIEERERISQDLHDGILQSLFAVGLAIEAGKLMLPPTARKTSGASLNQAIDQLNDVMREIRNFIAGLGSDLPEGKDLSMALQHMLALLTKNQATRVRLAVEDRAAKAVSAEQSLHLFRVIQEAVSNCIKHGHAQEAKVSLKMLKQGLRLSIRDNGCGFNPERTKGAGYGLSNMAARAQKIGGRLSVLSKPNEGTSIILDLPATGQGNEAMGT